MTSKMLERTKALMEAKREAVAADLLVWEKVEEAIRLAASHGLSRATIAPPTALKIKHTAGAAAAIDRLTREQFRHTWTEHRAAPTSPAGDQLEIEW